MMLSAVSATDTRGLLAGGTVGNAAVVDKGCCVVVKLRLSLECAVTGVSFGKEALFGRENAVGSAIVNLRLSSESVRISVGMELTVIDGIISAVSTAIVGLELSFGAVVSAGVRLLI